MQQQTFGINKALAPGQLLRRFSHVDGPGACTLKVQKKQPLSIDMRLYFTLVTNHTLYILIKCISSFFWKGHTHFSCSVLYKVHLVNTMCIDLELSF